MKTDNRTKARSDKVWLSAEECHLEDFRSLVERTTDRADYPFASEVAANVRSYDGAAVRRASYCSSAQGAFRSHQAKLLKR